MAKVRVAVWGTVGKTVFIDTDLGPRVTAIEEALRALGAARSNSHSALSGLQLGNDHPQYPLKLGRETIKGQWDFTEQIWAELGTEALPGISFTEAVASGFFAGAPAGDPYYPNTVLLLNCDGANGSTTFTDLSPVASNLTVSGGATVTTTNPKFGTGALNCAGGRISATVVAASERDLPPSGDFTIEFFARFTSAVGITGIMEYGNFAGGTGFRLYLLSTTQIFLQIGALYNTPNTWEDASFTLSAGSFTDGAWRHIAIVRNGSTGVIYVDGVPGLVRNTWVGTSSMNGVLQFGDDTGHTGMIGALDEIRITAGVAIYTAAFTPPTAAFASSGTAPYMGASVYGDEKLRLGFAGQLGLGIGASYGSAGNYPRSAGSAGAVAWTAPQALTRSNDTNVTLTLGGSPLTALFNATSLTLGWQGTLGVTRGGTGLATIAQGSLIYGSATNTFSALVKNTTATRYLSNTGTSNNPAWAQVDLSNGVTGLLPYTNIQNVTATSRVLGRISSGAGVIEELTGANLLTILSAAGLSAANPTASVGLSAVNGSATTYMRSDGAPALDQGIAPTWTGVHTFTKQAVFTNTLAGGTPTEGALKLAAAIPVLFFDDTDGGTDNRLWRFAANGGDFVWQVTTDAGSSENFFTCTRSAGQASTMSFLTGASVARLTVATAAVTTHVPLLTPAATTSATSLRIPHGTAPSAPTDGDMWTTTAGLYVRINGATVGPLA